MSKLSTNARVQIAYLLGMLVALIAVVITFLGDDSHAAKPE